MTKFIFAYHGGKAPDSEEEGKMIMAQWNEWFGKIGADLVDPGAPLGKSHTVSKVGTKADGGANPVSGYTIVTASGYDAAIALAKGCPMVMDGSGSVEVAELIDM